MSRLVRETGVHKTGIDFTYVNRHESGFGRCKTNITVDGRRSR